MLGTMLIRKKHFNARNKILFIKNIKIKNRYVISCVYYFHVNKIAWLNVNALAIQMEIAKLLAESFYRFPSALTMVERYILITSPAEGPAHHSEFVCSQVKQCQELSLPSLLCEWGSGSWLVCRRHVCWLLCEVCPATCCLSAFFPWIVMTVLSIRKVSSSAVIGLENVMIVSPWRKILCLSTHICQSFFFGFRIYILTRKDFPLFFFFYCFHNYS